MMDYRKHNRLKFILLAGMAGCLFLSGCGLAKKFIRPFPKDKEKVTEKGSRGREKFSRLKKELPRQAEGKLKVIKKVNPQDLKLPARPFLPEEELVYGVKWRGVPIGEIRLIIDGLYQLSNNRVAYRLVYEATTNPFFDLVYKVRDQVVSYFDCYKLIPWKTEKYLREGGYRRYEMVEFERNGNKAAYITSDPLEIVSFKPEAQDILSCFYYYRTRDIKIGENYRMVVFSDRKNWNLELKALKKKKIKTYLGKLEAILVEPEAKFQGVFFRKARMRLCFKDDGSKIPLIITAKRPFFGSITATLMRIEKKGRNGND